MDLTPKEIKELEKTYQAAMDGSDAPSYSLIYCEECEEQFYVSKATVEDNTICEHIMEKYGKATQG